MATGKNPAGPFEPAGLYFQVMLLVQGFKASVVSRPLSVVIGFPKQLTTDHGRPQGIKTFSDKRSLFPSTVRSFTGHRPLVTGHCLINRRSVKVVKLSTVSTGNLKRFLVLQLRPINRVVYPGSFVPKNMEPSSWQWLHA
jgi:hypothetical protein